MNEIVYLPTTFPYHTHQEFSLGDFRPVINVAHKKLNINKDE